MVLAEQEVAVQPTFVYAPAVTAAELRLLADFNPERRAEIEINAFIFQHRILDLRQLNSNPELLLRAGWYRHATFPQLFVPPGFFRNKKYYLTIGCQVTGDPFQFMHNERIRMVHPITGEQLFVGKKGKAYLEPRGWQLVQ